VNSTLGNLLHVMMGYEARPSGMQVVFYGTTFSLILLGMIWTSRAQARARPASQPGALPPIQTA
jgi:high-affinity iron transporter